MKLRNVIVLFVLLFLPTAQQYCLGQKNKQRKLSGEEKKIIRMCNRDISKNPDNPGVWCTKGYWLLFPVRWPEKAMECFEMAIRIDSSYNDAWHGKAHVLYAWMDLKEEAIACYDEAIRLNPSDKSIWREKTKFYKYMGRHEEELECYDIIIALDSADGSSWFDKGKGLEDLGRYEEALHYYVVAFSLRNHDVDILEGINHVLSELGRHEEIPAYYDRYIVSYPFLRYVWYEKALMLYELEQNKEAFPHFRELFVSKGDKLSFHNRGCECFESKGFEETLACYDELLALDSVYCFEGWYGKASILHKADRNEEALVCCNKLLSVDGFSSYSEPLKLKGDILTALGREDEAAACYNTAKKYHSFYYYYDTAPAE